MCGLSSGCVVYTFHALVRANGQSIHARTVIMSMLPIAFERQEHPCPRDDRVHVASECELPEHPYRTMTTAMLPARAKGQSTHARMMTLSMLPVCANRSICAHTMITSKPYVIPKLTLAYFNLGGPERAAILSKGGCVVFAVALAFMVSDWVSG